jgi:4-hydroxy-tetrahydrodipicolinate synthase
MAAADVSGVVAVLVTPFDEDEKIVLDDVKRQVEAAVSFGIGGVCLPAYAGEFYKLTDDERVSVVSAAAEAAAGRIPVFAARNAAALARRLVEQGADGISFALPRLFSVTEADLVDYASRICDAAGRPVLVQDFNPGGATVGASFCAALRSACPNFRYIKLEEPLLGPKLREIGEATGGAVRVLEGWGGMYLPELMTSGIAGVMPGLGHADVLNRIWALGKAGDMDGAMDVFDGVLAQIAFSLQNMELYLYVEKQLLLARGIVRNTGVRALTRAPDAETAAHAARLNDRVLDLVRKLGLREIPLER